MQNATTIDEREIAKFSELADKWWDADGAFKTLHDYNPVRIGWIRKKILQHRHCGLDPQSSSDVGDGLRLGGRNDELLGPFAGLHILDIGCGGGLLSEPMARLGGDVVGIDGGAKNIEIAKAHLLKSAVAVDYRNITVEELARGEERFDVILNMEVVEHVADVALFLKSCVTLLQPGGLMFIATINRTVKSYALAIVGAEYVMRLLPRGTHDWKKFLKPSEIAAEVPELRLLEMTGVHFNPITSRFKLVDDVGVNYMMLYAK